MSSSNRDDNDFFIEKGQQFVELGKYLRKKIINILKN